MKPEEIPSDLARRLASSAGISEHTARNALANVADAFVTEGWHRGVNDAMDAFVAEDQRLQAAMRCPECGERGHLFGGYIEHGVGSTVAASTGLRRHYVTWPMPMRRSSLDVLRDLVAKAAGGLWGA